MRKFLPVIGILIFLSCSSDKPADITGQESQETAGRGISKSAETHSLAGSEFYSLEIGPFDISRKSTIYIIPRGFKLSDTKTEWLVNGELASDSTASQFNAGDTKRGDKIQARVVIKGSEILSNILEIKNASPEIIGGKIIPEVFRKGDTLGVEVEAGDLDGDSVMILYEWTKNRDPAGTGNTIGSQLKRGDKISIKITPFDGIEYGRSVVLHRDIGNMPPMIIEDNAFSFDGKVYSVQVSATDPDGDTLAYSLKSARGDIKIDSQTGLLTWQVPNDFLGDVPITVSVTDGHGGESNRNITLSIQEEKEK